MALVFIIPVRHKNRSAGRYPEIQPLGPEIIGVDEVLAMTGRIPRCRPLGKVHVDPETVNVVHENRIPVYTPVLVAKVKHRTRMGMPPAGSRRPEVTRMGPLVT